MKMNTANVCSSIFSTSLKPANRSYMILTTLSATINNSFFFHFTNNITHGTNYTVEVQQIYNRASPSSTTIDMKKEKPPYGKRNARNQKSPSITICFYVFLIEKDLGARPKIKI